MPDAAPAPPTPERRRFLRWISAVGATVSAAVVGIPSFLAFLSPGFRRESPSRWVKLGETALLDIGVPIKRDFSQTVSDAWVEGRVQSSVWLYSEDGEQFTAFNGRCTHLACGFAFDTDKKVFHCPCHHGLFDMKTGAVVGEMALLLDRPRNATVVADGEVSVLVVDRGAFNSLLTQVPGLAVSLLKTVAIRADET